MRSLIRLWRKWAREAAAGAFGLAAVCALSACMASPGANREDFNKIAKNMTEDQVRQMLGEPARIERTRSLNLAGSAYVYLTRDGGESSVVFLNGSVVLVHPPAQP